MKYSVWFIFNRDNGRNTTERNVFTYKTIAKAIAEGQKLVKYHNGNEKEKVCQSFMIIEENGNYNRYITTIKAN